MSGVYLSLNQGWTYYIEKYKTKEGKNIIKIVSDVWKQTLDSTLSDFSCNVIDLRGSGLLAEGYELGHICGKFYQKDSILSNDILVNDLRNLIGVYREFKGKMIGYSVEKTNNHILVNHLLGLYGQENSDEDEEIENNIEGNAEPQLIKEGFPTSNNHLTRSDFIAHKIDFDSITKQAKKLGLAGEIMVLNYEKEKLKTLGRVDLTDKVKHISLDEGDGAGYDILSYDEVGHELFI